MAPLSYYWIISFMYLFMGKENFLNLKIQVIPEAGWVGSQVQEIFHAAQLAPIFSFPDS